MEIRVARLRPVAVTFGYRILRGGTEEVLVEAEVELARVDLSVRPSGPGPCLRGSRGAAPRPEPARDEAAERPPWVDPAPTRPTEAPGELRGSRSLHRRCAGDASTCLGVALQPAAQRARDAARGVKPWTGAPGAPSGPRARQLCSALGPGPQGPRSRAPAGSGEAAWAAGVTPAFRLVGHGVWKMPGAASGADRRSCHRKSRPPSRGVAAGPRGRAHTPYRRSRNEAPWPVHRPGAACGLSAARPRDPRDPRGTPWCPWRPVRPGSLTRAGDFAQARLPPFRKAHYSGAAFRGSRTGPRPCASASPPLRTPLLARSGCP